MNSRNYIFLCFSVFRVPKRHSVQLYPTADIFSFLCDLEFIIHANLIFLPQSLSWRPHKTAKGVTGSASGLLPFVLMDVPSVLLALWISTSERASSVTPCPGHLWPPDQRSVKRRLICRSGTRRVLVIGWTVSPSFAGSTLKWIKIWERKKSV